MSSQTSETEVEVYQNTELNRGGDPYPCKFCFRSFKNKQLLEIHMSKGHDTSKPYFCKFCPKRYQREKVLRGHMKAQHATDFVCDICSKVCSSRQQLNAHLRKHNNTDQTQKTDNSYNCEECEKVFTSNRTRRMHMKEHFVVDPYACSQSQCKRRFQKKIDLEIHEFTHKGVLPPANFEAATDSPESSKPFPCDQCSKSFAVEENLASHREIHAEGKLHNCEECELIFTTEYRLRRHLARTHDPNCFACDKCEKQFLKRSQLYSHKRKAHDVDVKGIFNCKSCSSTFSTKSAYKAHKYNHPQEFSCIYCPSTLKSKRELCDHLEHHAQAQLKNDQFKVESTSENPMVE